MPDTKITALTANTSPIATDIMPMVDDPGGTPATQKITLANLKAFFNDLATDAIWDAAGDIVQGTGANTGARLAIGTANQLLRVNSGATAVEWAGVGRVLINEASPSGTNTVTWNSIPATYKSLQIEAMGRTDTGSTVDNVKIWLNNDTTATNYFYERLEASDTTVSAADAEDGPPYFQLAGASAVANTAGTGFAYILDYAGTTFFKYIDARSVSRRSATTGHLDRVAGEWESTVAISRIDLIGVGNFISGSRFRLYGVY